MNNSHEENYEEIAKQTLQRYTRRYQEFGYDVKSLGWGSEQQQQLRFAKIFSACSFTHASVLDIGCGFAEFYAFLHSRNTAVSYTGIDLQPQFIEHCQKQYPDAQFICGDFLQQPLLTHDIVVMAGVMNYKQQRIDNMQYTEKLLRRAFSLTKKHLICDFISLQTTSQYAKEEWIHYYDPGKIVALAMQLSSSWQLQQNYPCIPQREMLLTITKED